jgi:hypothetical protein
VDIDDLGLPLDDSPEARVASGLASLGELLQRAFRLRSLILIYVEYSIDGGDYWMIFVVPVAGGYKIYRLAIPRE